MTRHLQTGFIILVLLLAECYLHAQVSGAAYLKLGIDARGISLGRAMTAATNGASAVFWNPAGLLNGDQALSFQATGLTNTTAWDQEYSTASLAYKFWRMGIGIGYINYGVYDIPQYDKYMSYYGTFNNHETAGLISIAYDFPGLVKVGFTGYYLMQNYSALADMGEIENYPVHRDGIGLSIGILVNPLLNYDRLVVGLVLDDSKIYSTTDASSTIANLGIAWNPWSTKTDYANKIDLMMNFEQERNYPIKFKMGVELQVINLPRYQLYLRIGMDDLILEMRALEDSLSSHEEELSTQITILNRKLMFGVGVQYTTFANANKFSIDYALLRERFRLLHFVSFSIAI